LYVPWTILRVLASSSSLSKNAVGFVVLHAGEEKLGRQHRTARRLDFQVDVLGPARIFAWHTRFDCVMPVFVGKNVPTQAVAGVIVIALGVGLPEVEQGIRDRLAVGSGHTVMTSRVPSMPSSRSDESRANRL
jgi:hypothetical protein